MRSIISAVPALPYDSVVTVYAVFVPNDDGFALIGTFARYRAVRLAFLARQNINLMLANVGVVLHPAGLGKLPKLSWDLRLRATFIKNKTS